MNQRNISDRIRIAARQNPKEGEYWLNILKGAPFMSGFPYDREKTGVMKQDIASIEFSFSADLFSKLMKLSKGSDYTLNLILLTGVVVLLGKYTGERDIVVGAPIYKQEMEGDFINTILPLRNRLDRHMTFKELLLEVRQTLTMAAENQGYPMEVLLEELNLENREKGFPLFDVVVLVENIHKKSDIRHTFPNIMFSFLRSDGLLSGEVEFNRLAYEKETVKRLAGHLQNLLHRVLSDVDLPLGDIDILSDPERKQLLYDFNDTKSRYPSGKTIHELFAEQAEKRPDGVSVVGKGHGCLDAWLHGNISITYRELNRKSDQLARQLKEKGVLADHIVAIMMERSIEMIIGILGILKAGGAYLPIDPDYPEERKQYMLVDSGARILLTDLSEGHHFHHSSNQFITLHSGDLAYVIYTSGTTGKPKGTLVEHRSLNNLCHWHNRYYAVTSGDRAAKYAGIGFDASVWEIFPYLAAGASIYIVDDDIKTDIHRLNEYFETNNITIVFLPTQMCELFMTLTNRSLRVLLTGGDKLKSYIKREYRLVNNYGPTENTVVTTSFIVEGDRDNIPIGSPITNTKVYVLDNYRQPQPTGVPGELFISGAGLSRGYLNRPELTAEKFVENPYLEKERMYKSGDLARWLPDGNIEFLGRIDNQVKIRGFRIEPGEIERALLKKKEIREAVVVAKENKGRDKYLCAYILLSSDWTGRLHIPGLKEYLSGELPDYMIPSYFMQIEEIPLTPSGKINRRALPEPEIQAGEAYIAPRNRLEESLVDIWSEVLGVERVNIGIDSSFFDLGGHSLKAGIMISKIHKTLDVSLPLPEVFKRKSIREIAGYIEGARKIKYAGIEPVEEKEYYKLSSAQKRLYFLQQMNVESTAYNISSILPLGSNIETQKLESTLKKLIARHESLRTSFEQVSEAPVQRIHQDVEFEIEYFSIEHRAEGVEFKEKNSEHTAENPKPYALRSTPCAAIQDFIRSFDLSKAPLLRVGLLEIDKQKHLLMADMHHIISDGVSMGIFLGEFKALYSKESLPEISINYKDFSQWHNRLFAAGKLKSQEGYWLEEFAREIPILNLPLDFARPPVQSFEGSTILFEINRTDTARLNQLAAKQETTLYMALMALFNIMLSKVSSQDEIVVGTAVAGRRNPELQQTIGMFVNTLALKNFPRRYKTFEQFLEQVKQRTLAALENQDYPFEELVEQVNVNRDTSRNPLFDVMFALENIDLPEVELEGLKLRPYEFENRIAKFDLTMTATETAGGLRVALEYCTKLFKDSTIERFFQYFNTALRAVLGNPDIKIEAIEIISGEDKRRILEDFNETVSGFPKDKTIHELFEEQVDKSGDGVAVIGAEPRAESVEQSVGAQGAVPLDGNVHLTYKELNKKSNRLAEVLREKGVLADNIVAIMMERSIEMIIGIMGILKAGGAYLPIEPDYPQERIDYMLTDSGAKILLSELGEISGLSKEPTQLTHLTHPTHLCYIIYTSGTTRRPKGVMTTHYNVTRVVRNTNYIDIKPEDRILQLSTYAFDGSVFDIYGALLNSASLVMIQRDDVLAVDRLAEKIKRESITVFFVTTALFNTLADLNIGCFDGVRKVLFGGEKVSVGHSRKAREYLGKDRIIHVYGPTETTVYATYYFIDDIAGTAGTIPIGKPISNTTIYILDKNMKPVPIGVYGEIYIGGAGTARGYLNNPELTAENFIDLAEQASLFPTPHSPTHPLTHSTIYRTGDLARWLPDGNIEFIGRTDLQVKIRGFRIELGEIETYLSKHNAIDEVTVIDRETERGEKYLCAYMVLKSGLEAVAPGASQLREYLSRYLPEYMIPPHFVMLERLPLTPNGKVDRKALPEPETSLTEEKYAPPGNEIEERLTETWADVLGLEKVGVNHNFFEIGGDSIKAIQVASQLKKHQLQLEIKDLLMNPTIRQLSPYVKLLTRAAPQDVVEGEVELTPIQRWFFETNFTGSHHFNQSMMLYRKEGFNKDTVKKVFTRIVEHHDALRMVYEFNRGEEIVKQRNRGLSGKLYDLEVIDLKAVEEVNKRLEEIEKESGRIQGSINLRSGPLVKLGLFNTPAGDYLLIVIHHLVVDGVSWRILLEDFARGYRQAEKGEPIKFSLKTDSFQHWASRLNTYAREMEEQEFLKQRNYWQRIEDAEVDSIPVDKRAPPDKRRHEYCESLYLNLSSRETQELLTTVNAAYHTEINDILLTALGLAMKEWGSIQRLLVNLEGHGREDILPGIDIIGTLGWFTTQFPVILDMEGDRELSHRIKIVKETLRKIPGKGIGYGIIKYLLPLEQKKKTGLEFKLTPEINFNYLGQVNREIRYGDGDVFKFSDVKMGELISPGKEQHFTIDISAIVTGETLSIVIIYNKYEFTTDRMEKLAGALKRNMVKIIDHCLQKKEKELTPGDLDYPQLSLERWEELKNRLLEHKQSIQNIYKLAPLQEGMLFHSLFERKTGTYFEQNELTVKGEIEESLFEKSFNLLVERCDILRTIFIHEGLDEPLQVVLKQRVFKLHREDIGHLPEDEKVHYLEAFKQAEREKGFDLSKDLLMKISLFKTGKDTYKIIWSFHHIIMDGWCLGIIFQDLIEIYRDLKADKLVSLESPPPYRNFIKWLERFDKKEALRVWSEYLEGFEQPAHLPGSGKSAFTDDYRLAEHWFSLAEGLTGELLGIARRHSVTFNTLVQTLWGILLQKYNNCPDVVFGSVVSGRPPAIEGIERMVGLFINTVPVRIKGKEKISVSRLVKEIHEESLVLRNYEYLSLAEIQANTCLGGELLDHIMVFENYPIETEIIKASLEQELGFTVEKMEVREQTNYDFVLLLAPGKCLPVKFIFNSFVFDIEFVERIERHFKEVIGQVVKDPGIDIKEIGILPEDEKRRILEEFNDTSVEFPHDKTIHDLFLEQMEKTPGNIALVFEDRQVSYGELNRKADQMVHLLKEKGVLAGDIVGIMMERSVEMIIGILGILKAGGAYLPIDPGYPEERIDYMLKDSNAALLLTSEELSDVGRGTRFCAPTICNFHLSLAYVIYTSGTTGKPKGTLVTHCNVNRVVKNTNYIQLNVTDRILQLSNYAFDGSVFDIYGALLNGAVLVMPEQEKVLAVDQLAEVIADKQVTVFFVTTALFNALVDIRIDCLKNIRKVLFGGERVSVEHSRKALEYLGRNKIIHVYGPTETTVYATYYFIDTINEVCSTIPIGAPVANTTAYILDSYLHPVPVGVAGEVYIGGDGVSRGYLNNPELTAERFKRAVISHSSLVISSLKSSKITNDQCPMTNDRLYRTGDLARWLPDGNIEFLGRIDHQVKLRGFRVELGEIESQLENHPAVKEAVVIVREDKTGDMQLCAYVVYREPAEFTGLREFLAKTLPDYMIPGFFVTLDKIPLTVNGKVDRKSLPGPGLEGRSEYIAPRDEVEKKLVEIWKEVLGLADGTSIGIEDNFFDLGGHSLKATILAAKIYREFQVRVTLGQIFQAPTVIGISGFIRKTGRSRFIAVTPVEEKEYYPLSSAQKQFYVMQQLDPNTTTYNIFSLQALEGAVEKEILEDIVSRLIRRHETLRTSFEIVNGEPVQRVHRHVEFKFEYYTFAAENITHHFIRAFDLSQAPLLRVGLIRLEENKHIFMVDMHHILSDFLSQEVLVNEVVALHSGVSLPGLKLQYRDYAHWQNRQSMSGELKKQEEYWLGEFRGDIPVLEIPTDFPRPGVKSFEGSSINFELDRDVAGKLANLARRENATLFMLYLAVVYVLLNKLSGREDIIVGTIVAGRRHPDLENIIGAFINTLTLRNYPGEDKTFRQFLGEVRKRTLEVFDNQDYRYEELVQKVMIDRDTSRNPLFDILYSFSAGDAGGAADTELSGEADQYNTDLRVEPYGGGEAANARFDITIAGGGDGDQCGFFFEYSTKLFKKETMQRYISYFKEIAAAAANDADILLKDFVISTDLSVVAADVYDEQGEFEF